MLPTGTKRGARVGATPSGRKVAPRHAITIRRPCLHPWMHRCCVAPGVPVGGSLPRAMTGRVAGSGVTMANAVVGASVSCRMVLKTHGSPSMCSPLGGAASDGMQEVAVGQRDDEVGRVVAAGGEMDECSVAEFHPIRLVGVAELPSDGHRCVPGVLAIDADGETVEQLSDRQRGCHASGADVRRCGGPVTSWAPSRWQLRQVAHSAP
jgi:hypothetical protein